mmetsp:Transcript_16356/g.22679  ORF Transcript_16356/g.22679 Transcript_16356/m.22679 type:complete len:271 (+) Transcript_16356:131-943(+)
MDLKRLLNDSHTNHSVLLEAPQKQTLPSNAYQTFNPVKIETALPPATSLLNFAPSSPQNTIAWVPAQPHQYNNICYNNTTNYIEKPIKTSYPVQSTSQENKTGPHGFVVAETVQQDVVLGLNDFMVFLNAHSKRPNAFSTSSPEMDIPSPSAQKKLKSDSNPSSPSMSPVSTPPSTPNNNANGNAIDELYDELWMRHFRELQKFQKEFGHTNVTRTKPEYKPLGNWVAEQRRKMRQQRLAQNHIQLLSSIGFEWDRSYYYHCKVPRPKSI